MMLNVKSLVDIIIELNDEFRGKTLLSCIMTLPEIGKNDGNNNHLRSLKLFLEVGF
jgi:hypothetical protein